MNPFLALSVSAAGVSTGETVLFWVFAPIMVIAALGLLFARKAVYATISVVFVMVCLAFIYTSLEAPFLGVVQVIVYTGAIMMLFLFVLMLVGVDSSDSLVETIKGQRWLAAIAGLGLLIVLIGALSSSQMPGPRGMAEVNAGSNPVAVASEIFSNHVITMELTGALLITAALGAMTLTHRERLTPKRSQLDEAEAKMQAYATHGVHPGAKPNAGVFAESNAATNPALTAYGQPVDHSVSRILRIRGQASTVGEISPVTVARVAAGGIDGPNVAGTIGQAGLAGMPGEAAPSAPTQGGEVAHPTPDDPAFEEAQSDEVPTAAEDRAADEVKPESEKKEQENL